MKKKKWLNVAITKKKKNIYIYIYQITALGIYQGSKGAFAGKVASDMIN